MSEQFDKHVKDELGKTYGRLVVVSRDLPSVGGKAFWLCKCQCGNTIRVSGDNLRTGKTRSCGCLKRDTSSQIAISRQKHGLSKSGIYRAWQGMKDRCLNSHNKYYRDYGGRGISVCSEWLSFERFHEDMGEFYSPGLTIERIDNNKGYSKENCRWATVADQNRNQRKTIYLTYAGMTKPLWFWAKKTGISLFTLHSRRRVGYSDREVIEKPVCRGRSV